MSNKVVEDPLVGQQLANFRLDRVIGRGGMATVYYGWDVKLERPVAVKVIDARYRNKPEYAQRFIRESRVVATWRHPNVLQIYYADDNAGLYYFVMEFIDGLDVRKLIDMYTDDGQLMPHKDVLDIGDAIAASLDYAHEQGVIHRDIKPSNVMVAKDGRVLLTDFGLALQVTEGSMGEVFGTPHYMAPEQAKRSADAVPQSDIYSLGVLLYEMLTGVVPFDDQSPTSVAVQHITETPPSPRELNPNLSLATEQVLLMALEKDPNDRYTSAKELMAALREALLAERELNPLAPLELPPLPASVQHRMTPSSAPYLSVADKVAMYLETRAVPPTEFNPPPTDAADGIEVDDGGQMEAMSDAEPLAQALPTAGIPRWAWGGGGVALVVLLVLMWGVFDFGAFGLGAESVATATVDPQILASMATATPTPTATATATSTPTATPTATATSTPTATPTATFTPVATMTPLPPTAVPTEPPFIVNEPEGDPSLLLIYNPTGFYVNNLTDRVLNLEPLSFNAITNDGDPTTLNFRAINGWRFRTVGPNDCAAIELAGSDTELPAQCADLSVVTFPGQNSADYFWRNRTADDISQFRVVWFGETIKICQIIDGYCTVTLPE
ncbi:MAG: serine/threonine protein kinase [Anaerolineales bacterium]|nr:serine/threonine protein kinase [Anaerolineales bacterium]